MHVLTYIAQPIYTKMFGMVYYHYFPELKSFFGFLFLFVASNFAMYPWLVKVAFDSFVYVQSRRYPEILSWYDLNFDVLLFTFRDGATLYVCNLYSILHEHSVVIPT